jgi:L-ascorbate metabolism protein UlaG (beta-lactamase superfamily)
VRITHYLYNAFLIEQGDIKIAIDPGSLFLYHFRTTTLIPESEWAGITHILVTHGDPDHYWHLDRIAEASGAAVVCNETMVRDVHGSPLMLGPRSKGLRFNAPIRNVHTISLDETITLDGLEITGIKATHGNLVIKLGPMSKTIKPGPEERIGWGAIGFDVCLGDLRFVNLGDTLLHAKEWASIDEPDVLMIPIGGKVARNTMDEDEALEAVSIIRPSTVIPCHYNCPGLWTKSLNPADDQYFKAEVEKLGFRCVILGNGESTEIAGQQPVRALATPAL